MTLAMWLFLIAPPVHAQRIEGSPGNWRLTTQHDTDAQGASDFLIRNMVGNIVVKGTTGSRISVVEKITSQANSEPVGLQRDRKAALSFVRTGNTIELVRLGEDGGSHTAVYEVSIPARLMVHVDIASGNVEVAEVQADVRIETGAGNVGLKNVQGRTSVRSGSGNIELAGLKQFATIHTGAGNVTAIDLDSGIDVTTGGGNVTARGIGGNLKVVTAGGALRAIDISGNAILFTSGGNITATRVQGRLEASSSGGEIEALDIGGRTVLSTNGGGIRAENIAGTFRAETMAGDVVLKNMKNAFDIIAEVGNVSVFLDEASFLNSNDASIEGGYGNITIQLPKEIKGSISAIVTESGSVVFNSPGSGAQITRERPTSRGEQVRKASYSFGQEGGRISVSTRSGQITISQK
ncbi:DUF4097 family beta strand repeat protein [bacterium]|nr:DUF4097 family beta strand repeat protein [bacterium]